MFNPCKFRGPSVWKKVTLLKKKHSQTMDWSDEVLSSDVKQKNIVDMIRGTFPCFFKELFWD